MSGISVIIPTLNEAAQIGPLLKLLNEVRNTNPILTEIIIVDGGSNDGTIELANNYNMRLLTTDFPRRSHQLNTGASQAESDILYFVHADVLPPTSFPELILDTLRSGYDLGCFIYRFDSKSRLLRFNSNQTRKDSIFTGGGDQTLFIKKDVFKCLGGFREDHEIMEDFEFYWRARKEYRHHIIQEEVVVSARKHRLNNWFIVQLANFFVFYGYRMGISQHRLAYWYKKLLKNNNQSETRDLS